MRPEAKHFAAFPTLVSSWDIIGHPCESVAVQMINESKDVA